MIDGFVNKFVYLPNFELSCWEQTGSYNMEEKLRAMVTELANGIEIQKDLGKFTSLMNKRLIETHEMKK